MTGWTRPAAWTVAALTAAWLRGLVGDHRVQDGLTIIAFVCAVAAALCVLELAAGRPPKHE